MEISRIKQTVNVDYESMEINSINYESTRGFEDVKDFEKFEEKNQSTTDQPNEIPSGTDNNCKLF